MAYVYCHYKMTSNPKVFYIGIGGLGKFDNYKRAKDKNRRSDAWKKHIKEIDWSYDILEDNLTPRKAKEREKYWIQLFGRLDTNKGLLINRTDGGDGNKGMSEERKKYLSSLFKNVKRDPNIIKKAKETLKSRGGFYHTQESKNKISEATKGEKNPFYGKFHSEETLSKMGKLVLNLETGIFYTTAKEASKITNYTYNVFKSMLNGNRKNLTNFVYC